MSSHSARHHKTVKSQHADSSSDSAADLDETTTTSTTTTTTTNNNTVATDAATAGVASSSSSGSAAAGAGYMVRAEERLLVGKETVGAGVAQLNKFVTTEHVYTSVPVTKEHAVLHTEPITEADNIQVDRIGSAHFEMPLVEEHAVASKKAVAVEKVMLSKEVEQSTDVVGADLKKENIAFKAAGDDVATNIKTKKAYTDGVEQ